MRLLLAEDDPILSDALVSQLGQAGFVVEHAPNGAVAEYLLTRQPFDAAVLDIGLPMVDGLTVLKRARAVKPALPVLVLTALDGLDDRVAGLNAGADDYLTKPFGAGELMARVRVALRHRAASPTAPEPVFRVGDLEVDRARRELRVDGALVPLTQTEWKLLELFTRHAGRVLTHAQILREVWGPAHLRQTHYVRVHVHALRRKIERDANEPRHLVTETGVGYRLRDEP